MAEDILAAAAAPDVSLSVLSVSFCQGGAVGARGSSALVKVLLVNDQPRVAASLNVGLRTEGFGVVHADTGADGLWQATEDYFDVIVIDLMLPGVSAYEVLRQLRDRQIWTPVLMLTAKDGEYDEADALDLGADDYVVKPFSFPVLVARLRALIRRGDLVHVSAVTRRARRVE